MTAERNQSWLLFVLFVGAGALAWSLALQPTYAINATALGRLPQRLGPWQGSEEPLSASVEAVLRADFNLQRSYRDDSGHVVFVYVGYYGTARGGRPEHVPRGCYTGAGWDIRENQILESSQPEPSRVQEYLVEREGERRLVHFWYRSHRRTGMIGGLDQNLDRFLGRITSGRADGALVRISTPLTDEEIPLARSRLTNFAARLDLAVAERWPSETPIAGEG